MGTERINFWKLANDYNYAHGVTPKPEVEPTEYLSRSHRSVRAIGSS